MTDESLARSNVRTQDSSGYLYVLTNESMPGLVKIGYTTRDPRERALELFKQASGVPTPFYVAFAVFCSDPAEAERDVFDLLDTYRVSSNREFFRMEADWAIENVGSVGLSYCSGGRLSVHASNFIVDAIDAGDLRLKVEKILGEELPPPSGADILSMVTAEEALPAAKRFLGRLNKVRDSRLSAKEGECEE